MYQSGKPDKLEPGIKGEPTVDFIALDHIVVWNSRDGFTNVLGELVVHNIASKQVVRRIPSGAAGDKLWLVRRTAIGHTRPAAVTSLDVRRWPRCADSTVEIWFVDGIAKESPDLKQPPRKPAPCKRTPATEPAS